VGEWENAIAAFQKRIDMGGWYEEVFQWMLDQGRALVRLGRDPTPRLCAAFEYCPWRAETLYELAMWHDDQANKCEGGPPFPEACRMSHRAAGYAVAKVAAALPRPDRDGLFVWGQMYDYQASLQKAVHAYYLAEGAIGVLGGRGGHQRRPGGPLPGQATVRRKRASARGAGPPVLRKCAWAGAAWRGGLIFSWKVKRAAVGAGVGHLTSNDRERGLE
jgi:hypothetical protein